MLLENRLPPTNAVVAAERHHVNLQNSLSKTFTNDIKDQIDIFVVMDKSNYKELLDRGIDKKNIYFLFDKDVPDPYKQDLIFFQSTYNIIANQLDSLSEKMK